VRTPSGVRTLMAPFCHAQCLYCTHFQQGLVMFVMSVGYFALLDVTMLCAYQRHNIGTIYSIYSTCTPTLPKHLFWIQYGQTYLLKQYDAPLAPGQTLGTCAFCHVFMTYLNPARPRGHRPRLHWQSRRRNSAESLRFVSSTHVNPILADAKYQSHAVRAH
jgi:hypothetical protein